MSICSYTHYTMRITDFRKSLNIAKSLRMLENFDNGAKRNKCLWMKNNMHSYGFTSFTCVHIEMCTARCLLLNIQHLVMKIKRCPGSVWKVQWYLISLKILKKIHSVYTLLSSWFNGTHWISGLPRPLHFVHRKCYISIMIF